MPDIQALAVAQLQLRLQGIQPVLQAAVEAQVAQAARLERPDLTPHCISETEAMLLLGDVVALAGQPVRLPDHANVFCDPVAEAALRAEAIRIGCALPLDALCSSLGLTAFEQFAVILCAATEVDRAYGRIYAFVLDNLARSMPCVELIATLGAAGPAERIARRHALSRFGRLRRSGVLVEHGHGSGEWRQELRLADGLFDYLTGDGSELAGLCRDPLSAPVAPAMPDGRVDGLAAAVRAGRLRVIGIWGPRQSGKHEVAAALADELGLRLRRWSAAAEDDGRLALAGLRDAVQQAAVGGGMLLVCTELLANSLHRDLAAMVAAELALSAVPIVLTGTRAWRPPRLLANASYAEIEHAAPGLAARRGLWREEMPELGDADADEMAARLRLGRDDVRAAVGMARTAAVLEGTPAGLVQVGQTAAALSGSRCGQFASLIRPKRGPDDLILPAALHRQVLEIGQFYRAWPRVAESWGFGRLTTGEGGIKALFTGDSGTGKTLAAEVIAGSLHMPLLRVELSRVVSKWVGETEKNLDAAFAEAEDCQAVLLFDEADALFGRRGNVETGVDRYANLEVSYLLQRLDDHAGVVILASNLKDNIDTAFTRRFQAVLHFPRPERDERLRLWRMAFPPEAPVDLSIDFEALANLDLTGAGIVGAARTAALLAAQEGAEDIGKPHIVRAIARQFRREARLLTPVELGPYAGLLQEHR